LELVRLFLFIIRNKIINSMNIDEFIIDVNLNCICMT
jgi:hypothetical protein